MWVSNLAVQSFPEENSISLEYGHNFAKPEFQCLNINLNEVNSLQKIEKAILIKLNNKYIFFLCNIWTN